VAVRTVYLYAKDTLGAVIEGVLFRIFNPSFVYETEGTTDVTGRAGPFLLEDGSWRVSGAKTGTVWVLPYTVEVTKDESFDLEGTVVPLPTATDPNRCRIYGVVRDSGGNPVEGAVIVCTPIPETLVVGGDLHIGEVRQTTSKDGVVDLELVRGVAYKVEIPELAYAYDWLASSDDIEPEGFTGTVHTVADQPSVPLGGFLFPRPARILFSAAALAVSVGAVDRTKTLTVRETNLVDADDSRSDALEYKSSDDNVATITVDNDGTINVTGVGAGTATLIVTRKDYAPKTVPDTALVVDTFLVTVS
jgi:hypothetical protein